jgi:hypothetical protein
MENKPIVRVLPGYTAQVDLTGFGKGYMGVGGISLYQLGVNLRVRLGQKGIRISRKEDIQIENSKIGLDDLKVFYRGLERQSLLHSTTASG